MSVFRVNSALWCNPSSARGIIISQKIPKLCKSTKYWKILFLYWAWQYLVNIVNIWWITMVSSRWRENQARARAREIGSDVYSVQVAACPQNCLITQIFTNMKSVNVHQMNFVFKFWNKIEFEEENTIERQFKGSLIVPWFVENRKQFEPEPKLWQNWIQVFSTTWTLNQESYKI